MSLRTAWLKRRPARAAFVYALAIASVLISPSIPNTILENMVTSSECKFRYDPLPILRGSSLILPNVAGMSELASEGRILVQIPAVASSLAPGTHHIDVKAYENGTILVHECAVSVTVQEEKDAKAQGSQPQSTHLVPAQAVYVLPGPRIPPANASRFAMFSHFNPSMVAYDRRMYWYQRFGNWNDCHPKPNGLVENFPMLCSAPFTTEYVPLCEPILIPTTVPPPRICANTSTRHNWHILGIQDVRLFSHSTGLWGLGCYMNRGCEEEPLLVQFDPSTYQVLRFVNMNDTTLDPHIKNKNWVIVDGSERPDGSMAVVKERNPLVVAWLDVGTGTVTNTTEIGKSPVYDPSITENDAIGCHIRGSSGYIPFVDALGRQGLLTTLHIRIKLHGYSNIFAFTEEKWPFQTLARSPYFYLNDLGVVKWLGPRLAEFSSPKTQFLSGLAYSGIDRETLLIAYGEDDCVCKVMKIATDSVRRLLT
mmetsp:Transcript_36863/g.59638  ORF Transcript_36863/g.59638 Transcript_36863/m.59638 type:complete len:480 (+) Transcript_36863:179-1618(+)